MVLTSASTRQRQRFLDGPHLALDPQLVERAPELAEHVGRPACILTDRGRARLALLLGADMVATIEVDILDAEAWSKRAPALGSRSAGCIDLNSFLTSNFKPLYVPALFELASPSVAPEALAEEDEQTSDSANNPFSVSNKEKRKLARVQQARDKSEASAQKLRQLEAAAASARNKTEAMATIARGIVAARVARLAHQAHDGGAPILSETFRKQLDDLELESIFVPLSNLGVNNMTMLKKQTLPAVLKACGLYPCSSGVRPRLTREQEATLERLTAPDTPAPPLARLDRTPMITPKPVRAAKPAPAPAPPSHLRPPSPVAAPPPAVKATLLSTFEAYAATPAEFTKFLKMATDAAEPPNMAEIKRSKPKMMVAVEDFLSSFITSANDIPPRRTASLNAVQLLGVFIDVIEVNGVHESDEDSARPYAVAESDDTRNGFAAFMAENGLEEKLTTILNGGITTVQALRRFTAAEVEKKCKTDLSKWEPWEVRALQTLTLKEVAAAPAIAPKPIGSKSAVRPGGDLRPVIAQAAIERFKHLPLVEVAMRNVPDADCPGCIATWMTSVGKAAVRTLGGAYELPELASEADNAENLEVMLEVLVKASIIEFNDLKAEAYEDDGLQCARLRARRLALEMSPAARPAPSTPVDPLIDVKQQAITRELLAAAGKTSETSAEKAAGEKRLLDVARDAELSARVLALHALETAGKLTLADFKKAASAVQVAELLKQSKIGLPTGASAALRTLWEAYSAVQRGINREVARELEKLMPEGADCEALANATLDGTLHVLDLQKIVSSKATKTVLGSTSPKTKGAAAKATTTDAASESYAHCITGLEFALEVFNPNDQSVIATMRQVRSEVESLHRSGFNRGDAANKLLSALLTEYDHDHEEYRRGRSPPLLSTAWETALKTNKISKLISSSGGENIKVTALEALVTEQAAKLKAAADEAHKATTKVDKMATRLTELEQLCAKRWKETKSNFVSDESGSESSRPATPNGGRGKGKISFVHPAKGAGAPAPASAPAAK